MNARTTLILDGVDLGTLGIVQSGSDDLWDGFSVTDRVIDLPGRIGAMLTSGDGRVPARQATITIAILADSVAARLAVEDQLNALLFGRTIEVRQVDRATRARYGRVQRVRIKPPPPRYLARDSEGTLEIVFPDPLAYTLGDLASPIAFGSTPVAVPTGSAACAPRTLITNTTGATVSSRVLSVLNAAGDPVFSMTLTGALLSGESLDVDHAEQEITKVTTAGVRSSGRAFFTAGRYLVLRPSDGDPLSGVYPQLQLSTAETGLAFAPRVYF